MMHLMPTKNPRLSLTLDPSLAAILRRLSELTGNSQSKIIAEILQGSEHIFAKIVRVLEAAEKAKAEVRGRALANLEEAHGRVDAQLELVIDEFDSMTGTLLDEVEAVARRGRKEPRARAESAASALPAGSAGRRPTPPSNRGVRSQTKPGKKPAVART